MPLLFTSQTAWRRLPLIPYPGGNRPEGHHRRGFFGDRRSHAGNTKAGLQAINQCGKAANAFLSDDAESEASFRDRLRSIGNDLRASAYVKAFEAAERV
jgi:hypothetical protein